MSTLNSHPYKPFLVTLTGVDARTDLGELVDLAGIYPVEFAVLLGNPDNGPRYMPAADVADVLANLVHRRAYSKTRFSIAVHLCGAHTRYFAETGMVPMLTNRLLAGVDRVQINGWQPDDLDRSHERYNYLLRQFGVRPILQFRPDRDNAPIHYSTVFDYVQDLSGGKGLRTTRWSPPIEHYLDTARHTRPVAVGYAGGLSFTDLRQTLPAIADAAGTVPYWIDMESSLRIDDELDLWRAERTLIAVTETPNLVNRHG